MKKINFMREIIYRIFYGILAIVLLAELMPIQAYATHLYLPSENVATQKDELVQQKDEVNSIAQNDETTTEESATYIDAFGNVRHKKGIALDKLFKKSPLLVILLFIFAVYIHKKKTGTWFGRWHPILDKITGENHTYWFWRQLKSALPNNEIQTSLAEGIWGKAKESLAKHKDNLLSISDLQQKDSGFSVGQMKERIADLTARYFQCINDGDFESMKPFMTEYFYRESDGKISSYKNENKTLHVDRPVVTDINILGWEDSGNEALVTNIKVKLREYITENTNNAIVRGSPQLEKTAEYECVFTRPFGTKTKSYDGLKTTSCPNCGAPIDINKSAKCPYCESVISSDEYDWLWAEMNQLE